MTGPGEQLDLGRADAYGRSFGDVYDLWYDGVTDAEATADFLAARHPDPGAPVLEVGVGTGRLAVPLVARGLAVVGLDGSASMLSRCPRRSPTDDGPGSLDLVRGDMRALPFTTGGRPGGGLFGSILVAFNTLFNLLTEGDQAALVAGLAHLIGPDGVVVVEMLDASALVDGPVRSIGRRGRSTAPVVVTATTVDAGRQRLWGQHLEVGDAGVTRRPWTLRWVTTDQLDSMASVAGLELVERRGSWDGSVSVDESTTIISVFRARLGP